MLSSVTNQSKPIALSGIGLRREHHLYIKENRPTINWFEVLIDNYLDIDGIAYQFLEVIAQDYPLAFHSVGMSLGSTDPINFEYLSKIKLLVDRFNPAILSDHVSWSSVNAQYVHDLYPLPFIEEAVKTVSDNIKRIQDFFGRRLVIENVSSYLTFSLSTMPEWEFINAIAQEADCHILLDINNIYVSSTNHHWDSTQYLNKIDASRVKQYHLGGHKNMGKFLLDTHGATVSAAVFELFKQAVATVGAIPTLIEWDTDIPDFSVLQYEAFKAQHILEESITQCCANFN